MAAANLLDLNEIRQLVADMGGDVGIVPELVDSLEVDVKRSIQEMYAAIEQADPNRLKQAAHRLKGGCGSLGATLATTLAQELESFGQNGETMGVVPMVEQLNSICTESIKALRELSL